jgi:hypothetical protein
MQRLAIHLSRAPLGLQYKGRLVDLPANIRQKWKGHDNGKHSSLLWRSKNDNSKKFYIEGPGVGLVSPLQQLKIFYDLKY